jgi:hypothetical protein
LDEVSGLYAAFQGGRSKRESDGAIVLLKPGMPVEGRAPTFDMLLKMGR